jgi:hypothetical protein
MSRPPQYGDQGRSGGSGGGGDRQFSYYQEERYWTDYLRIAAPVLGVILLLALAWFWINNLIGDDNASPTPTTTAGGAVVTVITSSSPTARPGLGTPLPVATGGAAGASGTATPKPAGAAKFKNGDKVVIGNTGGSGANMRKDASTSGAIVATLADGAQLTITGDSKKADGYTWWPVSGSDGDGWVVEDFLKSP